METEHSYITLNGLRFHYVTWDAGPAAPVLVALHGLRGYAETFEVLAQRLDGRFTIISLDQRGRGGTVWDKDERYYWDSYVPDFEAFVDGIGLKDFHLLGHSLGGSNALLYAKGHPDRVRSLIIEDIAPGASASGAGFERLRRELANTPLSFANWDEARAFWRKLRPTVAEDAIDSRVRHSMREDGGQIVWRHDQGGIGRARLNPDPSRLPDLWPAVDSLKMPALLVHGANSDFVKPEVAEQMTRRASDLRIVRVEGAGHYVHDDQPEIYCDTVEAFLREVEPAAFEACDA